MIHIFGFIVSRGKALILLLPFLSVASVFSQSFESTPPPPAHLPRLLWECEAGQGFNSCSVWMWHGSSYSAIWSNGGIGQLTVESGNAVDLKVQRTDTAGGAPGLSATYTAKWDGNSISGGKLNFTFKTIVGAGIWSGMPEVTPVIHSDPGRVITETNRELYLLSGMPVPYINWYTSELSGYAIHTHGMGGSSVISTAIEDFRVRGEQAMRTGERRQITLKAGIIPPNYDKGANYRFGEAIAAIYSDGSTFGDRNVIAAMLARRQSMIIALTSIGATMCTLGSQQASIADIATTLDRQHAAEDARSTAGKEERDAAYSYIEKSLTSRTNNHLAASQALKRTWDQLNQLRSGLGADPVKNSSGQLEIPTQAPLTCSLP